MPCLSHWSQPPPPPPMLCGKTWESFLFLFCTQIINWAKDNRQRAWIDTSIYDIKITSEEKQADNLPTVIPPVAKRLNQSLVGFHTMGTVEITIIDHKGYILVVERVNKHTSAFVSLPFINFLKCEFFGERRNQTPLTCVMCSFKKKDVQFSS